MTAESKIDFGRAGGKIYEREKRHQKLSTLMQIIIDCRYQNLSLPSESDILQYLWFWQASALHHDYICIHIFSILIHLHLCEVMSQSESESVFLLFLVFVFLIFTFVGSEQ